MVSGGSTKDAIKELRNVARQKAFHQRKQNEAILLMAEYFNGAENNWGFSKPIQSQTYTVVSN